ncbi:hypothetical protein [Paraburkholderia saeva]|uniref:Uncharacterized protein n=1 Tax=Paraburkholderia saeva TaxID=2777537 RepID=A0A9N8X206_9BURK|nr:hypothetical protein [Paraburkholderia saeva]CAG4905330.1 hypothetical protein LMG31841_03432 [Paraburkholderia saeva]CAG4909835.1 hypothetical protein R70241_03766 [Paraburkholderia saeva]
MDYSIALRFFVIILTLISIALVPIVMRRDPAPASGMLGIQVLPRPQWPGILTRAGFLCMLASFVLLLMFCAFMLQS